MIGAKPAAFCRWLFTLLAALPGDALDDLFPGSGAVGRAWTTYTAAGPSSAARVDASHPAEPDPSGQAPADALCPPADPMPVHPQNGAR